MAMVQNYPNPFKSQTTFKYHVSESGPVTLNVYDLSGKKVATVINENKVNGTYETTFNADHLSNGIYIASLSTGSKSIQSIKIVVNK